MVDLREENSCGKRTVLSLCAISVTSKIRFLLKSSDSVLLFTCWVCPCKLHNWLVHCSCYYCQKLSELHSFRVDKTEGYTAIHERFCHVSHTSLKRVVTPAQPCFSCSVYKTSCLGFFQILSFILASQIVVILGTGSAWRLNNLLLKLAAQWSSFLKLSFRATNSAVMFIMISWIKDLTLHWWSNLSVHSRQPGSDRLKPRRIHNCSLLADQPRPAVADVLFHTSQLSLAIPL